MFLETEEIADFIPYALSMYLFYIVAFFFPYVDYGKLLAGSSPNGPCKSSPINDFQDSAARNYSAKIFVKVSLQKTPAVSTSVFRIYKSRYTCVGI